jgi:hypothetical protein
MQVNLPVHNSAKCGNCEHFMPDASRDSQGVAMGECGRKPGQFSNMYRYAEDAAPACFVLLSSTAITPHLPHADTD